MATMNDMDGIKTAFKDNVVVVTAGRFDLEVDHVHCPWYASSDLRMICNKTSSTLPSHPSEAQAAQQSQVT